MKLKKSPKLNNINTSKTLKSFVSEASMRPVSGTIITRVNFPLTDDDIALFDRFSDEASSRRVSVLRASLAALERLDEDSRNQLIRQAEIASPKPGRPSVKK
ncbi:hypothetical protein SK355_13905 [Candidatus Fukatsuia symbiotica]|uniref:CopG family transcriptional regulator n=1 Tax=Candidatus Fukatsuia symbiotica TaxID=1878942 RepID=A0A2U8I8W5_9GAMM|nr:hypothetical protein [Candidatus Fukatsuia symbiotica]AWK15601.1 hypothetical protein CCS41_14365 [Candidatus Fukatsuia symbiotica]MEA9446242.1 hypothetical protein [Candidatus Fukatsuia symbiotica]